MPYQCVLFDLDNTLIDTEPLMRQALSACGCDVGSLDGAYLRTMSVHQLVTHLGRPDSVDGYSTEYARLIHEGPLLFDSDTGTVLEALRSRGVDLGLVTSSTAELATIALARCGLLAFFDRCIVAFADCARIKPNPDPVLLALEQLAGSRDATLYVGDNERDIIASHAAGVDFALAGWAVESVNHLGGRVPDVVLSRISDILTYTEPSGQ